jgi:hypothetical protein
MKFMMIVKAPEGIPPTPELMAAIGKISQEAIAAGRYLGGGGLAPSARGARIKLAGGKLMVTDGPFVEATEVIGGFAILELASRAEALEEGRRFVQVHADVLGPSYRCELEIREMADPPAH